MQRVKRKGEKRGLMVKEKKQKSLLLILICLTVRRRNIFNSFACVLEKVGGSTDEIRRSKKARDALLELTVTCKEFIISGHTKTDC